ncbi:MAG: hypothetical protein WCL16_01865 [bacterium]
MKRHFCKPPADNTGAVLSLPVKGLFYRHLKGRDYYRLFLHAILALAVLVAILPDVCAQQPYIGYVYPAGGRQGTTFPVTLGGQSQDDVMKIYVSGSGVQARLVEYSKRINNQERSLLSDQLKELRAIPKERLNPAITNLTLRLQKLVDDYVNQPSCASIANLTMAEVVIAPDAEPGLREIRVGTLKGISNPLVFRVGQLLEITAAPSPITQLAVLGKEGQSLRRKARTGGEMMMSDMQGSAEAQSDVDDQEISLQLPCTVNGQITPGSVDRFRFTAHKGQRLLISVQARELIPYMADAVPGWFQPVLVLSDARGREVAYDDDYRFKPDPVILYEIPLDGLYRLAIHDAIYRGREDFVYRITIGELPFVTSLFPLGGPADKVTVFEAKGWNLAETMVAPATNNMAPGVHTLLVRGRDGSLSEPVPFACDTLPECLEQEPNNDKQLAQRINLPVIINGRIAAPGDRDVFQFTGRTGDTIVAEVVARRLDSPLDSVIKLTDAAGLCIAFNDDNLDATEGLHTHGADACIRTRLPASGVYYLHLGDTQHNGGEAYAYRLRISAPQSDFALRVVPSSLTIRSNATASLSVHIFRKDGFSAPVKLSLQDPPPGFKMADVWMKGTQAMARVTVKTTLGETLEPLNLTIIGSATNAVETIIRTAVPAEDRMQAFLWRHLVPAQELKVYVFCPPPPPPKPKSEPEPSKPIPASKPAL